jgi:hypothetical protein
MNEFFITSSQYDEANRETNERLDTTAEALERIEINIAGLIKIFEKLVEEEVNNTNKEVK